MRKRDYNDLQSVFDKIFDYDFLKNSEILSDELSRPAVNIRENEIEFLIDVAAPGLKKKDLKISMDNYVLKVSADLQEIEEHSYARKEFGYHSFERVFSLPKNIDVDQIDASYNAGILEIKIPKSDNSEQRHMNKIEIK